MNQWVSFESVDRNGNSHLFKYCIEEDQHVAAQIWTVIVRRDDSSDRFHEASFKEVDEGTAQVIMLENHNYPEYKGKRISVALIPIIHDEIKRQIISSPSF